MPSPTVAPPLFGNVVGSSDGAFIIAEWQDPGGPPDPPRLIAPLHVHHRDDEAWYILEGTLQIKAGDTVIESSAGSSVFVPRGTPHTYWNPSLKPARYLLIMTPNIYRLIQEIHATPDRNPSTLRNLFTKHDSELL
jgi:mannose-6-phosphate isomerase-like protein (cupin superfamily)